jgi:hypothetical protein
MSEDAIQSSVMHIAADLSRANHPADSTVSFRWEMPSDEPDDIDLYLALKQIYADESLSDSADNELFFDGPAQSRKLASCRCRARICSRRRASRG